MKTAKYVRIAQAHQITGSTVQVLMRNGTEVELSSGTWFQRSGRTYIARALALAYLIDFVI